MLSRLFLFTVSLFAFCFANAQDKNPFQSIGKNGKILTLSNDKYEELFDQQDIQQIGTALVNVRSLKIVRLMEEKEALNRLDNTVSDRFLSVDPLTSSFPFYSPYQYAGNTPIQAIDMDGLEEVIIIKELYRSGAIRKVSIQYTTDNNDISKKINVHFREVMKANPDGTVELGGYLTDQKVIRVITDANGNVTTNASEKVTPQEQALMDSRSKTEQADNNDDAWDLTIGKSIYLSETERNNKVMTDKIAERTYGGHNPSFSGVALKSGSTLRNFNGSSNFFSSGGYNPMGGQLGNDLKSSLNALGTQLRSADNVKSITLNLNQGINEAAGSAAYNTAQAYGEQALNNAVNLLQNKLKGTGITVRAGTATTVANQSNAELKKSGAAVGVSATIK